MNVKVITPKPLWWLGWHMPKVIGQMIKKHWFLTRLYEQVTVGALGNGQPPNKMGAGLEGAMVII
jgi:hypothetical protein